MGSLAATAEEKAAALAAVADEKETLWSRSLKREGVPDFFRLCNGAGRCCNNTGALADNGSIGAGLDGGERDAIRAKATFEQLLNDSDLAAEVTLQPIRRFPQLDGAIIFSDILVILDALSYVFRLVIRRRSLSTRST